MACAGLVAWHDGSRVHEAAGVAQRTQARRTRTRGRVASMRVASLRDMWNTQRARARIMAGRICQHPSLGLGLGLGEFLGLGFWAVRLRFVA